MLPGFVNAWAVFYADSGVVRSLVAFAHIGGLLLAGGSALSADRALLRAAWSTGELPDRHIADLASTHRIVFTGLTLLMASGVLLAAADLESYRTSATFWAKMALIVVLAANGRVMTIAGRRAEDGHPQAWSTLRVTARLSVGVWFAITLLGAALPNVG